MTRARNFPVTITREEIENPVGQGQNDRAGLWLGAPEPVPGAHGRGLRAQGRPSCTQQDPKLKGLVLDLRNDPGGLLDAAVAISAAFLPEGVTVVSTNGQLEESKAVFKADTRVLRPAQR